ncbi:MAG: flagellar cap protein FliD N-terminal domain-containing protein, partial [Planctomycetota bacterium]
MGRIQSSVGLITGTDIIGTVDQLMRINAQPRDRLVARTQTLSSERAALAELTASVVGVQLSGNRLADSSVFSRRNTTSSNEAAVSVQAGSAAELGRYEVRTLQLAGTHTIQSRRSFASSSEALGLTGQIELTNAGFVDGSVPLSALNDGLGIDGGSIRITDRSGASADIDLSAAQTIDDVLTAIRDAEIDVDATTRDGRIQLIDQTGSTTSNLKVEQLGNDETAADLGLFGVDVAANTAEGIAIDELVSIDDATSTLISQSENGGQGISFSTGNDLAIQLADGTQLDIDFGDPSSSSFGDPSLQDLVDQLNLVDPAKLSVTVDAD